MTKQPRKYTSGPGAVRQRKEAKPWLYCTDKKCLWSLSSGPCPKHPGLTPAPKPEPDIVFTNGGSVWIITPKTDAGREWLTDNVCLELGWCDGYACEARYVRDIIEGAIGAGLVIE
jgi:hypothetical protein